MNELTVNDILVEMNEQNNRLLSDLKIKFKKILYKMLNNYCYYY